MKENRKKETKSDVKNEEQQEKVVDQSQELMIKERKIDLQAKNVFEIHQLKDTSDHFLRCEIKEETEYFEFSYEITNQRVISELNTKDWEKRLSALIQILQIVIKETAYDIPMMPDNFYIDEQGIVRVLKRDLQKEQLDRANQLRAFQALAGSLLQVKYTYDQLYSGGIELLKETERTKSIIDWQDLPEAKEDLLSKQRRFKTFQKGNTKLVKKTPNLIMKIALVIFSVLSVVMTGLYLNQTFRIMPPKEQALIAERAFIEKDYVKVIDSLRSVPIEQISKAEKYILAVSYVRSQSVDTFSNEAKDLILSKIVPTGTERVMDYWIYLGRLDASNAEEIAMSLSDNQLLLYAYLQEMDNVSNDKELDGTEKAGKLNDLEGKIQGLADKLGIDYDEDKQQDMTNEATDQTNEEVVKPDDSKVEDKTTTSSSKKG